MKFIITFLFIILTVLIINTNAQIPNPGFETWTGDLPESWIGVNLPGYPTLLQTNFAHSGQSALEGKVVLWPGIGLYPPVLYSNLGTGQGFSITQKYNSLKGYYAFKPNGGDVIYFTVLISNSSASYIGGGALEISTASDSYIPFSIPIYYYGDSPAYCSITFGIAGPSNSGDYHEGSTMYIDDLELSMDVVSGVESGANPFKFDLGQNYPNPFNPSTNINYQLPANGFVTLKVYDIIGNEVAVLVNEEKPAGNYNVIFNAVSLPSGIYFYKLQSGNYNQIKKMILLK